MAVGALKRILQIGRAGGACLLLACLAGCGSTGAKKDDANATDASGKPAEGSNVNVSFLLTMTFDEARKLSPASDTMPPFYKVAADEVTVTSRTPDNQAKRIRAKGKVYLQIDYREKLNALAQEALLSPNEVILRGKPLLKRGRTVVEGLDDTTVFYVRGVDLQVIGKHRITTEAGVTSTWTRSWKEGPNPLLPALSPSDVPKEMRASPLLPPPLSPMVPPSDSPPAHPDDRKSSDDRKLGSPKMREPQERSIGTPPST